MTDVTKTLVSLFSFAVGSAVLSCEAQAASDRLHTYAGPQAVSPGDVIHVTVELTDFHGNSSNDQVVNLSYMSDGIPATVIGNVQNGLVSFDVIAQNAAGMMNFVARADKQTSATAPVIVAAAEPDVFDLSVGRSLVLGRVEITSEKIVDSFGNPISDYNLVALSWMDRDGVRGAETIQLSKSHINLTRNCPAKFVAPLRIRAVLKNTEVLSSDISELCANGKVSA